MATKTNTIAARLRHAEERIERTEQRLVIQRNLIENAESDALQLTSAIASDSYAASFQSLGQYRTALLHIAQSISDSHVI